MKKHHFAFFSVMFVIAFILVNIPSLYAQQGKAKAKARYMVISEFKDIYYSLSHDERKEPIEANDVKFDEAVKAGEILEVYGIPGWNRNVTIRQYDSVEALNKHFENAPAYPYVNFEVYPIFDTGGTELAKPDAKKMKFLTICNPKDIWYSIPEDERKKIKAKTVSETGNFLEFYSIPGWYRYVAIEQYESIESLYEHFESDPRYPLATFEVYPLVEIDLAK